MDKIANCFCFALNFMGASLQRLIGLITTVMLTSATSAVAASNIVGKYAFTGAETCVSSPSGFTAHLQPVNPNTATTTSYSIEGVHTFNGNGTGSITGTSIGVSPPIGGSIGGANSSTFTTKMTYQVHADGTISRDIVANTFVGKTLTGPGAGHQFKINKIPLGGHIANGGLTIMLASQTPVIETLPTRPQTRASSGSVTGRAF